MSNVGIPLRVIAAYSGHWDLSQMSAYLEVKDEQILGAAATLSMLSPMVRQVGKVLYDDVEKNRTPVRSPVEKCMYDDVETNFLESPQANDPKESNNDGMYM
ncbi:MAG: hypothetical protein AB1861_21375 [Cyanobacteriota bacterium]